MSRHNVCATKSGLGPPDRDGLIGRAKESKWLGDHLILERPAQRGKYVNVQVSKELDQDIKIEIKSET